MAGIECFPHLGSDTDTVSFRFNDGGRVAVSRQFLTYISPVFAGMLQNEWKDSTTGVFVIEDIKREDFVEFLQCLDPGILKDITDANVLQVCRVADKYQSPSLIQRCEAVLINTIAKILKDKENVPTFQTKLLRSLLKLLSSVHNIEIYQNVTDKAIEACGHFSSRYYRRDKCSHIAQSMGRSKEECVELFERLPPRVQLNILKKRLDKWDQE